MALTDDLEMLFKMHNSVTNINIEKQKIGGIGSKSMIQVAHKQIIFA